MEGKDKGKHANDNSSEFESISEERSMVTSISEKKAVAEVSSSNDKFAVSLLGQVKGEKGRNTVMSPFSVSTVMAMVRWYYSSNHLSTKLHPLPGGGRGEGKYSGTDSEGHEVPRHEKASDWLLEPSSCSHDQSELHPRDSQLCFCNVQVSNVVRL